VLEVQPLNPDLHDRAGFACGISELDDYLRRFAVQHRRKGVSTIYVLVDIEKPSLILGFFTLSAAQVDIAELSDADRKKLPRYPVPCFRMGRLACRTDQRGQGLGKLLIGCAVERCVQASRQVAAYALIVDAKSSEAKAFYEHYGFKPCVDASMTLYLPLGCRDSRGGELAP
jgi:GNAT superfamily N-acetyltransferase